MNKVKITAIIAAAGSSSRMNGINKQLYNLSGKPVIAHTVNAFENTAEITDIIIVTKADYIDEYKEICIKYGFKKVSAIIEGGRERTDSVRCGIKAASEADYIAIHDGARACITPKQIRLLCQEAQKYGSAVPGYQITDTVKRVKDGNICANADRNNLFAVQTPQIFKAEILKDAYSKATDTNSTDDSSVVFGAGYEVHIVQTEKNNIKITTPEDLEAAKKILYERERK